MPQLASRICRCLTEMVKKKESDIVKYLGDFISGKILLNSASVTISRRKGMVTKESYEIRSIVDYFRSHTVVGGIVAGLDLWEMAVVPMMLYNGETWQEIDAATIKVPFCYWIRKPSPSFIV